MQRLAKNASVVAGATLVSRGLGFLRDVIMAYALGVSGMADAFFVAFRLPNLLRSLFAEGSLAMAFVPTFVKVRSESGVQAAFTVARSVQLWLLGILGLITLGVLLAPQTAAMLVASGFAVTRPELFERTAELVAVCFPYILCISSVALCMGILNACGHFLVPALAPCLLNICLIAASLLALAVHGDVAWFLAWGVLVAGVCQWLAQQPVLWRVGFSWKGPVDPLGPGVRRIGRLMLPTVLGSAVYQLNILIGTAMASFLPEGSVSSLYYADRLFQFPLGVVGVAVGVVALPSLSGLARVEDRPRFVGVLRQALGLTLFVNLPAAAGLAGLALPLVDTLFGHGRFSAAGIHTTSLALVAYAVGLPAFSCVRSLVAAYYALEDTRTPVRVAVVCLGVYVATGFAAMQVWGAVGLALASSVSAWANVFQLGLGLRRHLGSWVEGVRLWGGYAALSLGIALGCRALWSWGAWSLATIPVWAGAYGLFALRLGAPEATLVASALVRRFPRLALLLEGRGASR
ncbi:MAG TPA: murein biosynthesis integral membrane protein MurJ [Desulfomicrobiaceae bacterium]|jgi:putative peptidoglycan lipid II flippase|nr:putative peptidoglycan lipid flippase [Desulfomicrobiaceae bacterium]HCF05638.1 murein biosynthesis integral membrane protein MurJ [Desulfomicrobiaceae bacterium]